MLKSTILSCFVLYLFIFNGVKTEKSKEDAKKEKKQETDHHHEQDHSHDPKRAEQDRKRHELDQEEVKKRHDRELLHKYENDPKAHKYAEEVMKKHRAEHPDQYHKFNSTKEAPEVNHTEGMWEYLESLFQHEKPAAEKDAKEGNGTVKLELHEEL